MGAFGYMASSGYIGCNNRSVRDDFLKYIYRAFMFFINLFERNGNNFRWCFAATVTTTILSVTTKLSSSTENRKIIVSS